MALRILFTREDLQRVRISDAPDPMWELAGSLHHIQQARPATPYRNWHRQTRRRIADTPHAGELLGPLFALLRRHDGVPNVLTPARRAPEVAATGTRFRGVAPDGRVPDASAVLAEQPWPAWVAELATEAHPHRVDADTALQSAFDLLVRPHWPDICSVVAKERAKRLRTLSSGGLHALFSSLPGILSWDGELLRVRCPQDATWELRGRGLTLMPSHFCWTGPTCLGAPDMPTTLVYPAVTVRTVTGVGCDQSEGNHDQRRLAALLGQNRADCLTVLTTPHTTSALAGRVGVSVGSASKQATTLRGAGLVVSERQGGAVVHRVSPLGAALLSGGEPAA